jgi:hypothetical protein
MSDTSCHNEAAEAVLFSGYLTEDEVASERRKTKRTLRAERQRGSGPPYVRDGKSVRYPIDGFRAWLKANECRPVRASRAA